MLNTTIKFILIALLITGCSSPDTPKVVAGKFLNAFQQHDFIEAAEYGTKETGKILKQIERIEEVSKEKMPLPKGKIIILSEEIEGKNATVYFREGVEGAKEEKLKLIKVKNDDGSEWKIALSKTDLQLPEPILGPGMNDSLIISNF